MDKKLPICIVLVMLMSCFSCKQPQQPTEDADMDTQWVDSSQHLYQYGICIDSLDVKEYLMKNGDNPVFHQILFYVQGIDTDAVLIQML